MRSFILSCCLLIPLSTVTADVFYCDPVGGSTSKGDGSASNPWGTLESVLQAGLVSARDQGRGKVHGGDTLRLRTGNHGRIIMQPTMVGSVTVNNYESDKTLTVEADKGNTPQIERLNGVEIRNWAFRDLHVATTPDTIKAGIMVRLGASSDVLLEGITIRPKGDPQLWTVDEWIANVPHFGIWVDGERITIRKSSMEAVHNGIGLKGRYHVCEDAEIYGFMNDGMNVSSSDTLIARNRITDQVEGKDDNHHDGIQVFELTGTLMSNLTIRDNFIARSTGRYKIVPMTSVATEYDVLQGISLFDGKWSRVTVENNVVITTAYNAIVLAGTQDSVIRGNTVFSQSNLNPWVCVRDDRFGAPTSGVLVERNLAPTYLVMSKAGVSLSGNFSYERPASSWNYPDCQKIDPVKTFYFYDRQRGIYDAGVRPDSPAADKQVLVTTPGAGARQ